MSTPFTISSRISPDSPTRIAHPASPIRKVQRTYSSEGVSFRPTNKYQAALLDKTDKKVSLAVAKQLRSGSSDLIGAMTTLPKITTKQRRESILFSPRPLQPTCRSFGADSVTADSTLASDEKRLVSCKKQ